MALTTCSECGSNLSSKAAACPGCGASQRDRISTLAKVCAVVLGLVVGFLLLNELG
ncbi:MAG: hypothetical protein F2825_11240 [Actinobacteria bacterium]|uniref:Unannotated protein n=1 Tax=freshwater metagenome TaxID=449393 RepID=A0A6J7IUZ2_9ZZZZ|nr:hypothetical protein [Actinomycetota bacterium]